MAATLTLSVDRPSLFDDPGDDRSRGPASRGPAARGRGPGERGERPAGAGAARHAVTLDHIISGAWDELSAHRPVSCPVCRGQMAPRYGAGAQPVGGRCHRCGSSLG
ncbi:MAG TPA: hypothetical protein VKB54_02165 [Solirubrobacteraceae bacterium]|nr:hypothetical protein [Solirubrobacteraceae bacterium]